jgi:hypothetical protein
VGPLIDAENFIYENVSLDLAMVDALYLIQGACRRR